MLQDDLAPCKWRLFLCAWKAKKDTNSRGLLRECDREDQIVVLPSLTFDDESEILPARYKVRVAIFAGVCENPGPFLCDKLPIVVIRFALDYVCHRFLEGISRAV